MISAEEREKMLLAHSIGPKMISYLERSGITELRELCGRDAQTLLLQIHVETGVKLNKMGLDALKNLIALANLKNSKEQ